MLQCYVGTSQIRESRVCVLTYVFGLQNDCVEVLHNFTCQNQLNVLYTLFYIIIYEYKFHIFSTWLHSNNSFAPQNMKKPDTLKILYSAITAGRKYLNNRYAFGIIIWHKIKNKIYKMTWLTPAALPNSSS